MRSSAAITSGSFIRNLHRAQNLDDLLCHRPEELLSPGAPYDWPANVGDSGRIRWLCAKSFAPNEEAMNPLLAASSWPPVIQTLIGAVAAVIGGAFAQWFTWQKERRALAAAFAGEIQCVVEATNFRSARRFIEQGKVLPTKISFPIFETNVAKIGFLPADLAGRVAVFYSDLGGVFLDFETLDAALIKQTIRIANADEIKKGVLQRLDALESAAIPLVAKLRQEAKRRWRF